MTQLNAVRVLGLSLLVLTSACAGGGSLEKEAEVPVAKVSVENNASMGREVATEIFRTSSLIQSSESLKYINTVARYIGGSVTTAVKCPTAVTPADQVRVAILQSPGGSNAAAQKLLYSVPGGFVFVSTAFLANVDSEDELAGLLAREIVHSLCEHGVPKDLAAQAADGWAGYLSKISVTPLKRDQQMFADKVALNSLYKSGYEILPYVRFVEKNETSLKARSTNGKERALLLNKMASNARGIRPSAAARKARFETFKGDLR